MKEKNEKAREKVPFITQQDVLEAFGSSEEDLLSSSEEDLDWEYDTSKDTFLIDKRQYKVELDWSQFVELQIQALITLLFKYSGHDVENWHLSDRSREEGADLVVINSDGNIAIAVKIKPDKNDIPQLIELAERKETRKIYVYIETPTKKFQEFLNRYKSQVEFWNETALNTFFVNTNIGFTANLVFDSNSISKSISEIRTILCDIRDKCINLARTEPTEMSEMSRDIIWRLKDNAVSLHKSNQCILPIVEEPLNLKNKQLNTHFVKIFIKYLDILNVELKSYIYYFKLFYPNNEILVHNSIISNVGRSHWRWLSQYRVDNSLDTLANELASTHPLHSSYKNNDIGNSYWQEYAKNNDVLSIIQHRARNLMIFGSGLEAIVDDIAREYGFLFRPTL